MNSKLLLSISQPKGMPDWQWLDLRVQLLLMSAGYKRAVSVHMADDIPEAKHSLGLLAQQLTAADFVVEIGDTSIHSHFHLYVGTDIESTKLLQRALSGDLPMAEADRIHGELSGFPQTAINAFLHKQVMSPQDFSDEIRQSPAYIFGTFRFSKDHWQQELTLSAEWAETIKRISPDLYQGYLNEFTSVRTAKL